MNKTAVSALQLVGALVFAGLCIALAISSIDLSRVWTVWFTIMVFGLFLAESRRFWTRRAYWLILGGLLAVHLLILILVKRSFPGVSLLYYVVLGSFECAGLYVLILVALE